MLHDRGATTALGEHLAWRGQATASVTVWRGVLRGILGRVLRIKGFFERVFDGGCSVCRGVLSAAREEHERGQYNHANTQGFVVHSKISEEMS